VEIDEQLRPCMVGDGQKPKANKAVQGSGKG
jgi:hypothetical protein